MTSGGLDSTVLCRVFCQMTKAKKIFECELVHVNFMLRGLESEGDEDFVRELAAELEVGVRVYHPERVDESVQVWARNVRRKIVREANERGSLGLTAHHLDDVAETILFRLARGSRAGQVGGLKEEAEGVWRPFIHLTRAELESFAQAKKVTHRVDSSNAKLDYSRNWIRAQLIPGFERLFPGAKTRLQACFEDAEDCESELLERLWRENPGGEHGVDEKWLKRLKKGSALLIIGKLIEKSAGRKLQLGRIHLELIYDRTMQGTTPWTLHLPGNLEWISQRGQGSVRTKTIEPSHSS